MPASVSSRNMLPSPANLTSRDVPMTRCVALSLFAASLFLSTAVPAPHSAAQAAGVDASIVLVRVAGPWQAGGRTGFSRLVVSGAANRVSLSVEWIGSDGAIVQAQAL